MATTILKATAGRYIGDAVDKLGPADPYYEYSEVNGKKKRKQEAKILKKVKKRAYYLDRGFKLCGLQCGWTFFLGLIPFLGEIINALLSYNLIIKKAKQIEGIPDSVISRMVFNTTVSTGMGLVPLVGDIALAAWKGNWRSAAVLEDYLRERGAANLLKQNAPAAPPVVPPRPAASSSAHYL
ncbi:hypothetical protein MCUN1_003732 [Malassezia cuniculi]|uniref:Uncharacterized protein n=1 Tax=Malassezia cuniculi TaxID=948313 RepID=A0AAF0EY32_9BASI|nr:hypothetical protein MCUN1_003732 [Malassezia cuniculi]